MKADAPEMQAMLNLISSWLPDFFIDSHTTDGADYQYIITFGIEYFKDIYKETEDLLKNKFSPFLYKKMSESGFLSHPYVGLKNWSAGLDSGITETPAAPRLSTGYCAVQNRPSLLIETHMLKPYKERVFSTKAAIESVLGFCSENKNELIQVNKRADSLSVVNFLEKREKLPLKLQLGSKSKKVPFKGLKYYKEKSEISGTEKLVYLNEKVDLEVDLYNDVIITKEISIPKMYIVPKEWSLIIERMKLHGILVDTLKEEKIFDVKRYRFSDVKFASTTFEGRERVSFKVNQFFEKIKVPAGSFLVSTNQRTCRVIAHLLEPESEDSFMQWGFFNAVLEQKEYFEPYVMEKIAEEMIQVNPSLKKEFEDMLASDEEFKNNPNARLNFFYERSPYYDSQLNVYPILRID
jgi:hypothetical protein